MKALPIRALGCLMALWPAASLAQTVTNIWTGGGDDALASTAANWSQGIAPLETHQILLNEFTNKNLAWDTNTVQTVASWTQVGYTGTVTIATRYPGQGSFTNFTIAGDCIISNGVWTHTANTGNNSAPEIHRLSVTIGGTLEIATNATLTVQGKGLGQNYAIAAHGGRGYGINTYVSYRSPGGRTYGSVVAPTRLGQGGFERGGGAIRLTVTGPARIDGIVSANGVDASFYPGAGGSIWLTAGLLTGSGVISANGGNITGHSSAGGGRIALVVTNSGADFSGFTGIVSAYGGRIGVSSIRAGAGSVYLETADDSPGNGELVIDNDGSVNTYGGLPNYTINTSLSDTETLTYEFSRITLTNNGVLIISSNVTLVATNTVIRGDPSDSHDGIQIVGGALIVPDVFAYSNYFINIARHWQSQDYNIGGIVFDTEPVFHPKTALTIGTNAILAIDQLHGFSNTLTIAAGGELSHTFNPVYAALQGREAHALRLALDGDLIIEPGGRIDATGKGFIAGTGPGAPPAGVNGGASYGGSGAAGSPCYGSIASPTNLGSGGRGTGSSSGGGFVHLAVSGKLRNDGSILANASPATANTGSGGSILINAGELTGVGSIAANSATNVTGINPGGGGRVAIVVTNAGAAVSDYTGAVTAFGARKMPSGTSGGAGTVVPRDAGQGAQAGTLIVDNDNLTGLGTQISSNVTETTVANVGIRRGGFLLLATNQTLTVSGIWSNSSVFAGQTDSAVVFAGGAGSTSTIRGATTFMGLTCIEPGKTLVFEAGATQAVAAQGRLILQGDAVSNVVLRSTVTNTAWHLNVDPLAEQNVAAVDVKDSHAGGGAEVTAMNSVNSLGNTNWRFITITPGDVNTWTGNSNTFWFVRDNWSLDRAPVETDAIVIPGGRPRYPVFDAPRTMNRLDIEAGGMLNLNGYDLTVTNAAVIAGALNAAATETLTFMGDTDFKGATFIAAFSTLAFTGDADQVFDPANRAVYQLAVSKPSGSLTFLDGIRIERELRSEAPTGARTLTFQSGATFTVRDLVLLGSSTTPTITLRSSTGGLPWFIKVSGHRSVRGVDVQDSHAGGGLPIPATDSTDNGGNQNWFFGAGPALWLGTSGTSFHSAANWDPPAIPDAGTRVLVEAINPLVMTGTVTLLDLTLGGGSAAVTATVNATLTVVETITILSNATLALNRPTTVSNGLYILTGGMLTHSANTTAEANKLDLTIGGDVEITAGGSLDVTGKGYGVGRGPGAASGASHGGRGGTAYSASPDGGPCYGSIIAPTNLGSGGTDSAGGGAVILRIAGTLRHDGVILANSPYGLRSGAGGSIYVTAAKLAGTGIIRANGGASSHSHGAGGRIALIVTHPDATFADFTGPVEAFSGIDLSGNARFAGAGTIYQKTATSHAGRGTVRVDNQHYNTTRFTDVPPNPPGYRPGEADVTIFRVSGAAQLRLTHDFTLGDIWLESANARLDLGSNTLYVNTLKHDLGPGTVINHGAIIWLKQGSILTVR